MKKTRGGAWLSFLLLCMVGLPAVASEPEADIVAVSSAQPLESGDAVPGLVEGQRVMERLQGSLELLRGGVPEAARPGLSGLLKQLRGLLTGDGSEPALPDYYRKDGELWLPVRVQRLQVWLDAPDLRPRPIPGHAGGRPGNLPATARRTAWLPVGLTARRVEQTLPLLSAGPPALQRVRQLLQLVLRGTRTSLTLERRPLILAYYGVESALASAPRWDGATRRRLRHAAEALADLPQQGDLADRLQAQADRLTPDLAGMQSLALALRQRITAAAGIHAPGSKR